MDTEESRASFKYLHKKGMKTRKSMMICSNGCPCYSTVKKWVVDYKQGRENTDDDARTGRPNSTTPMRRWKGFIVW